MMRSRLFLSLFSAVALLAASAAQAGTLDSATWTQVTQGFPMTRTGGQLGITGTSTGNTSISAALSYPAFVTKFFIPKTVNGVLDLAISITQGGPQNITATPGMALGAPGVAGTVNVRTAAHLNKGVDQSMYVTGANTLVMVPVSIGVAGLFTGSFLVLGILHNITVDFYAWAPGTQMFDGLTSKGMVLPTVTAAGSWNLTPGGDGTVTLVSPSKISIDCGLAQRRTASFTSLRMVFVPEPGSTLLLLGAGALGLVLVGSRKR
jgi:hypothetical protein